jgi:hypothetical protein
VTALARIPLTVPHYYDFREDRNRVGPDLVNPESWDAIRETTGPFGLPPTREEWERAAITPEFAARAETIAEIVRGFGVGRLCSYGVGAALLELNLFKTLAEVELVCTDYAPRTVRRLTTLFPEADVRLHDFRTETPLPADLHLLHRVDSELPSGEWRRVLAGFRDPVLFVATQVLDWQGLLSELRRRFSRDAVTRAGYVRTEAGLRSLWRGTHDDRPLAVGELTGFLLMPRDSRWPEPTRSFPG